MKKAKKENSSKKRFRPDCPRVSEQAAKFYRQSFQPQRRAGIYH
jgi:hypothetical protein